MANKKSINLFLGLNSSQFQKGLTKAQRRLKKFGSSMKKVGRSMTTSLTLPLVGIGAIAGKTFMDFEQSMLKVKAISGATGQEFKALEENAKALGSSTMFTASQVAGLQLELSKLGLTPEQINQSTSSVLSLAQATDSDLSQAAEVAAKTMNAFGLEANDMNRIADVMADSFSSSALDMTKFETAMASVAPVAKQAGSDIEGTTAILGVLINNGVEASTAGTALRNIFLDLANEGSTMSEAMAEIQNSTNPLATSMEMFGKRGATVATILANNGKEIQALNEDFKDSEGEAKRMAEIMDSGLGGSLRKLKSQLEGVAIQLGQILVPIFQKLIGFVKTALNAFNGLTGEQKKLGVALALVAGAIGPVLTLFGSLVTVMAGLLSPALLVISALVAAGYAIFKNWEPFKKLLVDVINFFIDLYNESILFRGIVELIALAFKNVFAEIKFFAQAGWAIISGFGDNIRSLFGGIGDLIKGAFTMDKDLFKQGFAGMSEALGDVFDPETNKALGEAIDERGKTIAENLDTAIKNTLGEREKIEFVTEEDIQGGVDAVTDMVTQMKNKLTGMLGGGGGGEAEPATAGFSLNIPDMASGGGLLPSTTPEEEGGGFWSKSADELAEWASSAQENIGKFQETWGKAINQAANIYSQFIDGQIEKDRQKLDADLSKLEEDRERSISFAEATISDEEELEAALFDINKNFDGQSEALQEEAGKKERKLIRKQASANKVAALFNVGASTADAVMKAVAAFPATAGAPWAGIAAGMGIAQAGAILANPLPPLAQGGLAFGPTAALVGDNPNASVDPEVIAPLSKLQSMMGGMQKVEVQGIIRGEDIWLTNNKQITRQARLG